MRYIDNVTLTILMILRDKPVDFYKNDAESARDLQLFLSYVDAPIRSYESSKKHNYTPCIQLKSGEKVVCADKVRLEDFLKEYSKLYKSGELEECTNANVYESFDALQVEFITEVLNNKGNNKKFITTDIKYAPLFLEASLENASFVEDITIANEEPELIQYPITLYERDAGGEATALTPNWQEYFVCRYVVNAEWYVKNHKKQTAKVKGKDKPATLTERDKVILGQISKWIKSEASDQIPVYYLLSSLQQFKNQDALNNAISSLNNHCKKIFGLNEKVIWQVRANKKSKNSKPYYQITDIFDHNWSN